MEIWLGTHQVVRQYPQRSDNVKSVTTMEYLLAHDVGTSGDKASIPTVDGHVLATAYERYPTRYPQLLRAEQDPEEMWRAVWVPPGMCLRRAGFSQGRSFRLC